ncbi:UNVERIFIED_CONTAM: N-acetylmuramoyl-L-alanine amidase [Brevibacillus sp. OAP136]
MAPTVIIDPGHGGIDPGGGTNALFAEKDLVLKISLYQQRRFAELNISATLTRTTDQTLESEARAALVKSSDARFCLSNHINAGGGQGAELIYSIYGTAAFPRAMALELQAAGMAVRRVYTRTYPGNAKQDYYFMHRDTGNVETVIIEYGFADNAQDAQLLNTKWQSLAEAVVKGFCTYNKLPYTPPKIQAPPTDTPAPSTPGTGQPNTPAADWKQEAVEWLYEQGLLTDATWRNQIDQPLPLWAEAILLRRLYEKLTNRDEA